MFFRHEKWFYDANLCRLFCLKLEDRGAKWTRQTDRDMEVVRWVEWWEVK